MATYNEHLKLMKNLYSDNKDSSALRRLWQETFKTRRQLVQEYKIKSIEEMLEHCPMLVDKTYV